MLTDLDQIVDMFFYNKHFTKPLDEAELDHEYADELPKPEQYVGKRIMCASVYQMPYKEPIWNEDATEVIGYEDTLCGAVEITLDDGFRFGFADFSFLHLND